MKKSELIKLVKEEVSKQLNEVNIAPVKSDGDDIRIGKFKFISYGGFHDRVDLTSDDGKGYVTIDKKNIKMLIKLLNQMASQIG